MPGKSILLNRWPPARPEKRSSKSGRGYCSGIRTGFTVTLKSLHKRRDLYFFMTGTIGVAQSLMCNCRRTPAFTSLSNSASTLGLSAYATGLAFKHIGWLPGFTVIFTTMSFILPSPSLNTSKYLFSIPWCFAFPLTRWTSCQFSLIFSSQVLPSKAGWLPSITYSGSFLFCILSSTATSITPLTGTISPV